jgi:hypothetical protein
LNKVAALFASVFGLLANDPTADDFHAAEQRRLREGNNLGHKGTPAHRRGLGGTGYTKAIHEESKKRRVMAAKSRRINRGKK